MAKNRKRTIKRAYKGALANPITITPASNLQRIIPDENLFQSTLAEQDNLIKQAWHAKVFLLAEHYGIAAEELQKAAQSSDVEPWRRLALELAVAHVPGFKVVWRRSGAPIRNSRAELIRLRQFIRRQYGTRRLSVAATARALAKSQEFKQSFPMWSNTSAKTLQNLMAKAEVQLGDAPISVRRSRRDQSSQ